MPLQPPPMPTDADPVSYLVWLAACAFYRGTQAEKDKAVGSWKSYFDAFEKAILARFQYEILPNGDPALTLRPTPPTPKP